MTDGTRSKLYLKLNKSKFPILRDKRVQKLVTKIVLFFICFQNLEKYFNAIYITSLSRLLREKLCGVYNVRDIDSYTSKHVNRYNTRTDRKILFPCFEKRQMHKALWDFQPIGLKILYRLFGSSSVRF